MAVQKSIIKVFYNVAVCDANRRVPSIPLCHPALFATVMQEANHE